MCIVRVANEAINHLDRLEAAKNENMIYSIKGERGTKCVAMMKLNSIDTMIILEIRTLAQTPVPQKQKENLHFDCEDSVIKST